MNWTNPAEFKLGINMAGAVSAGAYTAGVLDFLMEALEEWQKRKEALRAWLANPAGPMPELVPLHDVSIEVFTGASAGGMCAAIASVMVQQDFTHIKTAQETGTNNTFYEAWVNQISITELLKTLDVADGKPFTSLLDSTILDRIAAAALTPQTPVPRPYISKNLNLILSLTNVRGTPYALFDDPSPSAEETTTYYGDTIQFETVAPGAAPTIQRAKPLPSGQPGQGAWPQLQDAAKATGAVPLVLAPRVLQRDTKDYMTPPWTTPCTAPSTPITPAFSTAPPVTLQTLNVDGGVTDNSPFEFANDFLAVANPVARCQNPTAAERVNCAVITVAPFPSKDKFDPDYKPADNMGFGKMLGTLVNVLLSQSRFLGESLSVLTSGNGFNRFVVAPSDTGNPGLPPLQGETLSAFGGFFSRDFRAHDFLLGRRNCQQFLKMHFVLPVVNPVLAAGLDAAGAQADAIQAAFSATPPAGAPATVAGTWIPVIPCTGTTVPEVTNPTRAKITVSQLSAIVDLIIARLKAIKGPLIEGAPWILEQVINLALSWPFVNSVKSKLQDALVEGMAPNVQGK